MQSGMNECVLLRALQEKEEGSFLITFYALVPFKKSESRPSSRVSTARPTSASKTKPPLLKRLTSKNLGVHMVETMSREKLAAEKITKDSEYCIRVLCENEEVSPHFKLSEKLLLVVFNKAHFCNDHCMYVCVSSRAILIKWTYS